MSESLASYVPAYASLHDVSDFAGIPIITKDDLRQRPVDFVDRRMHGAVLWHKRTSGTTGEALDVFYERSFYFAQLLHAPRRIAGLAGINDTVHAGVWCVHLTDTQSQESAIFCDPTAANRILVRVVVDQSRPESIDEAIDLLCTARPQIVSARPEVLELLASHAPSATFSAFGVQLVISSGSALRPETAAKVRQAFGAQLTEAYGLSEFGVVAVCCRDCGGLHFDDPGLVAEVLDTRDQPTPPGTAGELVLSSTANSAMPLVRYRTGDIAVQRVAPCPTGWRGLVLERLVGRTVKLFTLPTGAKFSPTHFTDLVSRFPIMDYRMTQSTRNRIDVVIRPRREVLGDMPLCARIAEHVRQALPEPMNVVVSEAVALDQSERFRSLV